MGVKVVWSEPALEELGQALEYIAFDQPAAARGLWQQARAATRNLRRYPLKGRMVPEYQDPAIRELIVGPLRLIYTTEEPGIATILAAVRSERLLDPGGIGGH
ncbi:MAG: type II toxin-antitoxin system RelE/ParE family toxin [Holophaga sp.]|nr:type II toxin-antitoxin system RelE/ParE family toxin [Holophaga sp.]